MGGVAVEAGWCSRAREGGRRPTRGEAKGDQKRGEGRHGTIQTGGWDRRRSGHKPLEDPMRMGKESEHG